jgi:hypothetical protein
VAILRSCLERIPLILKRKRHSSLTPRLGNNLASRRLKPFRFYQSVRSDGLGSVENLACIDTHLAIQFGSGRSAAALFSAGNRGGKKGGQTMDVVLRWVIIGIVALAAWPRHSAAQDYPTHSVTCRSLRVAAPI